MTIQQKITQIARTSIMLSCALMLCVIYSQDSRLDSYHYLDTRGCDTCAVSNGSPGVNTTITTTTTFTNITFTVTTVYKKKKNFLTVIPDT